MELLFPIGIYKELLIAVIVIQACICAIGYVGNIIICVVIVGNKTMRTTTNVYLFNLAIADLIMLTTGLKYFTTRIWYMSKNIMLYGLKSNCFLVSWTLHAAFTVSIMTIIAFTMERYLAICHPFLARRLLSVPRAIKLIIVIWIIGSVIGYLITRHHHIVVIRDIPFCVWDNRISYALEIESLIFFAFPFMILLILYILIGKKLSESSKFQKNQSTINNVSDQVTPSDEYNLNKKVFKMLVTIVVVFFISWAPFHIGRLLFIHRDKWQPYGLSNYRRDGYYILIIVQSIGYFISSAINPIIYNAMSNKFRDAFKEILIKLWYKCWCTQMKDSNTNSSKVIETNV